MRHLLTLLMIVSGMLGGGMEGRAQDARAFIKQRVSLEERSEKRIALVIGNGTYTSAPLKNPPNDARLMAKTLRSVGFEVLEHINQNKEGMQRAIIDFGRKLRNSKGVGLFYFAGHGMQIDGKNYLIPVGVDIEAEEYVKVYAVDVGEVLVGMERSNNRLNMVVLDACRNNPFSRSFRSATRGLAKISAPSESGRRRMWRSLRGLVKLLGVRV